MTTSTPTVLPLSHIQSYHAHIYFNDALERERAALLRDQVAQRFSVQLGRWRETPVGPHTRPMYQIAFERALFDQLVPWLMLNRQGLAVLVHPNTDNPKRDHGSHALWLGEVLALKLEILSESTAGEAPEVIEANTVPTVSP